MALFIIRLAIFALIIGIVATQVFLPLWRGQEIFPWLRGNESRVSEAEQRLAQAETNLQAAKLIKKAEDLNTEAWAIEEETYTQGERKE